MFLVEFEILYILSVRQFKKKVCLCVTCLEVSMQETKNLKLYFGNFAKYQGTNRPAK